MLRKRGIAAVITCGWAESGTSCLMNVQPNILFIVHEVFLSVGDDANNHNLLQKGAFYNAITTVVRE